MCIYLKPTVRKDFQESQKCLCFGSFIKKFKKSILETLIFSLLSELVKLNEVMHLFCFYLTSLSLSFYFYFLRLGSDDPLNWSGDLDFFFRLNISQCSCCFILKGKRLQLRAKKSLRRIVHFCMQCLFRWLWKDSFLLMNSLRKVTVLLSDMCVRLDLGSPFLFISFFFLFFGSALKLLSYEWPPAWKILREVIWFLRDFAFLSSFRRRIFSFFVCC